SGALAASLFFSSTETAMLDTKAGGMLLTEPTIVQYSLLPAGGLSINWSVPNNPALAGRNLYVQAVEQDPGATFGFSFTRGLRLTFGP
ncbi:MAG TPA: hypothetical protein VFD43_11185, partial [Planctomycetota bacterium]|nr:hypothetical protein [Planctomycetota bacterium]